MKWHSGANKGSGCRYEAGRGAWGVHVGQWHHRVRKCADRMSTRTRIRWVVWIYPLWRPHSKGCGFSDQIRRVRVDERPIQQHFFPDSANPGSMWTGPYCRIYNIHCDRFLEINGKECSRLILVVCDTFTGVDFHTTSLHTLILYMQGAKQLLHM